MPKRILLLGATGTIGRATTAALVREGHAVTSAVRPGQTGDYTLGEPIQPGAFDAIISCLASRTGHPDDAWSVDYRLNAAMLARAQEADIPQFVLLSAICVQKPKLGFQKAKLAFEADLQASGLTWSIVRPTAFFKSLSGQINRVRAGKPFLLFGDGTLTRCKPISDGDLARFLCNCLDDPDKQNRILPIGGPGPALSPLDQGHALFEALEREPRFKHVPVAMMSVIITVLHTLGLVIPSLRKKAELARIGRYYATESMLVWDAETQRYNADATPEFGEDTLAAHYTKLARGDVLDDRGDHAVF